MLNYFGCNQMQTRRNFLKPYQKYMLCLSPRTGIIFSSFAFNPKRIHRNRISKFFDFENFAILSIFSIWLSVNDKSWSWSKSSQIWWALSSSKSLSQTSKSLLTHLSKIWIKIVTRATYFVSSIRILFK